MTEDSQAQNPISGKNLNLFQKLTYSLGNFGVGYGPATFAFLAYFFYGRETESGEKIVYVSIATFSIIWFLCNALNGITDPIVGYLSDRSRSRWGRRKPWVIIGAPFLAISFFFIWCPPTETPSLANNVVLFTSLFFFWFFFTVVVAPYLSLLPEITPHDKERVQLSAIMSVFGDVLGSLTGNLLPVFVVLTASGIWFLEGGYQSVAFIGAIAIVFFSIFSVLFVKETYVPPPVETGTNKGVIKKALSEFGSTFKNKAFLPYLVGVFFYRMAIMITLTLTPFVATKILGSYPVSKADLGILSVLPEVVGESGVPNWEAAAGYLMMVVLVGAMVFFVPVSFLAAKTGKRILFILALAWLGVVLILMSTIGYWPGVSPVTQAMILFALAAIPVAIALVVMRPLLADVIDADEKLTGLRREGVYNGMEGLIMKVAAGLGPLIAGIIFAVFGASVEDSLGVRICGPVAGVCLLIAAYAFTKYPIKK
ncbi:MAG: MFS transporter [Deltaproteobacteria bacterium]|nr:MFS transporter [Deltaproteobacteria bacterium]